MKKLSVLLAVILVLSMTAVSSFALPKNVVEITVYNFTPTIDGVIEEDEWDVENAIVFTEDMTYPWTGDNATCGITFYFSWDDEGLYLAADVDDDDVQMPADLANVYNKDAFQIALDPGGQLAKGGKTGGMFFSIGPFADGGLGAVYHPYGGSATNFEYEGASSLTDDGWCFEMFMGWEEAIEILDADGFDWTHGDGEFINCIFCMLDRDASGAHCYKTGLEGKENFNPADYSHRMNLVDDLAPSLVIEEITEDTGATTAPATFDVVTLAGFAAAASAIAAVVAKKRK